MIFSKFLHQGYQGVSKIIWWFSPSNSEIDAVVDNLHQVLDRFPRRLSVCANSAVVVSELFRILHFLNLAVQFNDIGVLWTRCKSNTEKLVEGTDTHLVAELIGGTINANDQVTAFLRAFAVCGFHSSDRKEWQHRVVENYLDLGRNKDWEVTWTKERNRCRWSR